MIITMVMTSKYVKTDHPYSQQPDIINKYAIKYPWHGVNKNKDITMSVKQSHLCISCPVAVSASRLSRLTSQNI